MEYLTDANGSIIGTSTRTITLGPGDTSQRFPMPPSGVRGNWARVRLENSVLDDVGTIKSLRMYYIPRGDFVGEATE